VEKTKAIIEFVKTLFIISVTSLFSIFAYLFVNFNKFSEIKFFLILYGIITFMISSLFIICGFVDKTDKKIKGLI